MFKDCLGLVVVFNGLYGKFFMDYMKHRDEAKAEPETPFFWPSIPVSQVLGTFGISDFALGTIVYRKFGIVPEKLTWHFEHRCTIRWQ